MSVAEVLPPSPPTTSSRRRPYNLPFSLPIISTPEDSPASGPDFSSLGSRKRVEFHPQTSLHQSSDPVSSTLEPLVVKPLPPSRECQSSGRPILKATAYDEPGVSGMDGPSDEKVSLNETMESLIQQIASSDNVVVVDAYQTLAATIKAYNELPDEAVLKSKLSIIAKHIRQHLGALDKSDSQPTDLNLVTSALKVAVILVWSTDFSGLLNDDFRIFLTDRAIQIITEHTAPKSVIIHYLHLLATQDFRPGIITSNHRASRLIDALKGLTDHIKGNGIISERLLVFTKLLDQARSIMKVKTHVWLEPMLLGMASSIPDTRSKALALGRKACQAYPPTNSIYHSVREALDLKQESGKTLSSVICRKLEKMISNRDNETVLVPQIWAVVLLLANHASTPIDKWHGLKEWLVVIQRCFNGSDVALRQQANLAWNRFIFIARPHEAPDGLMSMLAKPIIAQLERQSDKSGKGSHALAISSYCNLLYYAFRSATTQAQCTRAWNEYIVKVMRSSFFEKNPANADIASRVLMALLWDAKTSTKVWNENRAHENRPVDPEELPTIDCKWVRSRCQGVLDIFEVLFKYSSWGLPGSSDQAFASKAWRHLLKALKDAASKEIKMTNESRGAVTAVIESLTRLLAADGVTQSHYSTRTPLVPNQTKGSLARMAIAELGLTSVLDVLAQRLDLPQWPLLHLSFMVLQEESSYRNLTTAPSQSELNGKCLRVMNKVIELQYSGRDEVGYQSHYHSFLKDLCQTLDRLPRQSTSLCLSNLESGLSLWLRDENKLLSEASDVDSLCKAFVRKLATVTPAEVAEVDGIFAAAFLSTHKTIVNAMATLWNEKYGSFADLAIGPHLGEAISKLNPYVELDMPFVWDEQKEREAHASLRRYETQDQEVEVFGPPQHSLRDKHGTEKPALDKVHPVKKSETLGPTKKAVKLRHQDSQIDFVPVESSPPAEMADSQRLTDRQKAVLERQRSEPAVVFADLRSSPRPRSSRSQSRDCEFARKAASMLERPATPTLPDQNDTGDADPVPSPTPKSRLLRAVEDAEIPSSPPSMQGRNRGRAIDDENMSSPPPEVDESEEQQVNFDSPSKEADATDQHHNMQEAGAEGGLAIGIDDAACTPQKEAGDSTIAAAEYDQNVVEVLQDLPEQPEHGPEAADKLAPPLKHHLPSSQVNTDELNEMSATQLSNDLEWSQAHDAVDQAAVEVGQVAGELPAMPSQAEQDIIAIESEEPEQRPQAPASVELSQSPSNLRKRKRVASGYADKDGRHRRRKTTSQSRSLASQEPVVELDADDEIYDEIVVSSSSPGMPLATMQATVDSQSLMKQEVQVEVPTYGGRQRGSSSSQRSSQRGGRRERHRLSLPRSPEPEEVPDVVDAREVLGTSQLPGTTEIHPLAQHETPKNELQRHRQSETQKQECPRKEQQVPQPASAPAQAPHAPQVTALQLPMDLMASLQHTLALAKASQKGAFDLRAVADICFQIQHVATLAAAGQK